MGSFTRTLQRYPIEKADFEDRHSYTHRQPTHPGQMLLVEFLVPAGLTQRENLVAIRIAGGYNNPVYFPNFQKAIPADVP